MRHLCWPLAILQDVNVDFGARQHKTGRWKLLSDWNPDNCIGLVHKHWISQTRLMGSRRRNQKHAPSFIRTEATFSSRGQVGLVSFFIRRTASSRVKPASCLDQYEQDWVHHRRNRRRHVFKKATVLGFGRHDISRMADQSSGGRTFE